MIIESRGHPAVAIVALAFVSLLGCSAAESEDDPIASDDIVSAAPLGETPHGAPTQFPIVLVNGFLGSPATGFASWNDQITLALKKDGHRVFVASVPGLGNVKNRGRALAADVDRVLRETGAQKVNIIAHSMGGLDARELVSVLGYGDRVASVTTISTPHRGSLVADISLKLVAGATDDALAAVSKLVGRTLEDETLATDADLRGALTDLSEANAPRFNGSHPDDARVYYQSWAGVSSVFSIPNAEDESACAPLLLAHRNRADLMSAILAPAAPFVTHGRLEPTDGFVLVSSAKHGNFRGCVPADHADEIGVFAKRSLDPHTGFDFVRFNRNIAFDLAARGF